jgi:hypothetical protein
MAYINEVHTEAIQVGTAVSPPVAAAEFWPSMDPQGLFSAQNWGVSNFVGMHNQLGVYNGLGLKNLVGFLSRVGAQTAVGGQADAQPTLSSAAITQAYSSPAGSLLGGWTYNGSNICAPCPSDERSKINVSDLQGSLDKVLKLRGVSFNWNSEVVPRRAKDKESTSVGLIAQEVEKVVPELIVEEKIEDQKLKTVEYGNLTALLVEAIKEQQEQINSLKETVQELSTKLAECCP